MNIAELEAIIREQGRRLATAESEIAALKANQGDQGERLRQLAQPKPSPAEVRPAAEPEGARILHPVEVVRIGPTRAQLEKLLAVVLTKFPILRTWSDDRYAFQESADYLEQFVAAFSFIARTGRAGEIDHEHSLTWWTDHAYDWCHRQRMPITDVRGSPFIAAALAHGDVGYSVPDEYGNVWSLALSPYGGRPAKRDAWKAVLAGEVSDPSPGIYKPLMHASQPVRVEASPG